MHFSPFLLLSVVELVFLLSAQSFYSTTAQCTCNTTTVWNALRALYDSTDGPRWQRSDHWLQAGSSVCDWYGVYECSNITLDNNNLHGTLPPELGTLASTLTSFSAANNLLYGSLPRELHQWTTLAYFDVGGNSLSGTLPTELSSWTLLWLFNVRINRLSGTLPPEFSSWTQTIYVFIDENNFTGTLPPEYAAWTMLYSFVAGNNSFWGTLPPEYATWSPMGRFVVRLNNLSGTLPPEYGAWMQMDQFDVYANNIVGSLPPQYGSWTSANSLSFAQNRLTGTLPPEYSAWTRLNGVTVSYNLLTGTLPPQYSAWPNFAAALFDNNDLSGPLPAAWTAKFFLLLAFHNNPRLHGAISSGMSVPIYASLCNTSVCGRIPSTWAITQWLCQAFSIDDVKRYKEGDHSFLRPIAPDMPSCSTPAPPPPNPSLPHNATTHPPAPKPPVALTPETQAGYPLIAAATIAASAVSAGAVADGAAMDTVMAISVVGECNAAASSSSSPPATCAVGFAQPAAYLGLLVGAVCAALGVGTALGKMDAWRLPSRVSMLGSTLVPMVLAQAVSLLGMPPSPVGGAVVLGVLGVWVCCALRLWFASRLTIAFPCRWVPERRRTAPKPNAGSSSGGVMDSLRAVAVQLVGTQREPGHWVLDRSKDAKEQAHFIQRYGALFENYVPARRWFSVAEWAVSCCVSVVTGLRLSCVLSCGSAVPAMGVLMILHSACAALQPHQRLLRSRWLVVSSVLRAVAGVLLLIVPRCAACADVAAWLLRVCAVGSGQMLVCVALLLRMAKPKRTHPVLTSVGPFPSNERLRRSSTRNSSSSKLRSLQEAALRDRLAPAVAIDTASARGNPQVQEALLELITIICTESRTARWSPCGRKKKENRAL